MRSNPILFVAALVALTCPALVSSDAREKHTNSSSSGSTTTTSSGSTTTTSSGSTTTTSTCAYASTAAALGISNDGCAGAPAGTAQLPSLLTTYGSNRPKWDVAGVDYFVGVPSGTTLQDPATSSPAGCTYNSSSLTTSCNGSSLVISGYDFSLHGGTKLSVTGSNITVTANKFALAPNCSDPPLYYSISSGALAIVDNTFDGGGATCTSLNFGSMIYGKSADGSTISLTYNHFYNTPQDVIDAIGPPSGSAVLSVQYNLFNIQGFSGHPDGVQFSGGNFTGSSIQFNTYYNPFGSNSNAGTQPFHVEAQLTSAISNTTVAYNTIVTPGSCNGGTNYPSGCSINFPIACKWDSGTNSNNGFSAFGNYIDWSGAIKALSNGYGCQTTSWGSPLSNIDMKTGGTLAP